MKYRMYLLIILISAQSNLKPHKRWQRVVEMIKMMPDDLRNALGGI